MRLNLYRYRVATSPLFIYQLNKFKKISRMTMDCDVLINFSVSLSDSFVYLSGSP